MKTAAEFVAENEGYAFEEAIEARDAEWQARVVDTQIHGHGKGQEACAAEHWKICAATFREAADLADVRETCVACGGAVLPELVRCEDCETPDDVTAPANTIGDQLRTWAGEAERGK